MFSAKLRRCCRFRSKDFGELLVACTITILLYLTMANMIVDTFLGTPQETKQEDNFTYYDYQTTTTSAPQKKTKFLANVPDEVRNTSKYATIHYGHQSCGKYPGVFDIQYNNIYWQTLKTSNGTFYFYGAYYDSRAFNRLKNAVRILAVIDRINPIIDTYCQLWFEDVSPSIFVKTYEYLYIWNRGWGNYKNGVLQAYLITCIIPVKYRTNKLRSVSIVEHKCDNATNNLRVWNDRPEKKKDFAVCVKGMDFTQTDLSVRLVEWLELLSLLGADKVFMYQFQVHPKMEKVFDYYESINFVDVTPLTLPGGLPNHPELQHSYLKSKVANKRQIEVIPYNDCLYRNLYTYKYVVLIDTDEIIMPINRTTWQELLEDFKSQVRNEDIDSVASFNFRNVYFFDDANHKHGWFDDIPQHMHMLQHIYRSKKYTNPGLYIKSFHNTERVLTVHNHFPFSCINGSCYNFGVDIEDGHLQHYRKDCVPEIKTCEEAYKNESVLDKSIWRYKDELIERVQDVLNKLELLPIV